MFRKKYLAYLIPCIFALFAFMFVAPDLLHLEILQFGAEQEEDLDLVDPVETFERRQTTLITTRLENSPTPGSITERVHLLLRSDNLDFTELKPQLSQEMLPILYDVISDAEHFELWNDATYLIGLIGTNETSSRHLIEFFGRSVMWSEFPKSYWAGVITDKIAVLESIGLTGGTEATEFLVSCISKEGAQRYSSTWLNDIPDHPSLSEKHHYLAVIRGVAALGMGGFKVEVQHRPCRRCALGFGNRAAFGVYC